MFGLDLQGSAVTKMRKKMHKMYPTIWFLMENTYTKSKQVSGPNSSMNYKTSTSSDSISNHQPKLNSKILSITVRIIIYWWSTKNWCPEYLIKFILWHFSVSGRFCFCKTGFAPRIFEIGPENECSQSFLLSTQLSNIHVAICLP